MNRTAVSVCMATYDAGKYLIPQIESILAQLLEMDELIVVDDASKDGTFEVLEVISEGDARIKLTQNTVNHGVKKTFEIAVSLASNDLIFLTDQDDVWLPDRVNSSIKLLQDERVSAVLCNAEFMTHDFKTGVPFFRENYHPKFTPMRQLIKNNFIGCCMCFRRSLLITALPFPSEISMHDWWIGVNAILYGRVEFDSTPRILYRRHDSNLSPSVSRSMMRILNSRFFDFCSLVLLHYRFYALKLRGLWL